MAKKTATKAAPAEKAEAPKEEPKIKLVPMYRGDETGDIHPDEVENLKATGWSVVES